MELGDAFETIGRGLATGTKTKKHSLQCNLDEPGPSKSRKKPREKKSKKAVVDDERQLSASLVLDDDMDITHKRHNTKGVVTGTEDDSGATLVVVDDAPPPQESLQKKQPVNDIMEEDDVLSIHVEIIETVSQSLECSPPRPPSFPAATSAPSIPIIKNPQPDQSVVSRKPSKKVKMPASSSTTTAKPKPASKAKTDGKPPRKPRSKKAPLQTSLLPVTDALRTLESNLSDRLGSLLHSLKSQTTTTSQTKTSKYFYDPPLVPPKPCNIRNFVVESRSQSIEFCKPSRASLWERAGREFSQEVSDL